MSDTGKKVEVRFGAFSCTIEGYDDPVDRMREILMLMQQMIRETPALSDHGTEFGEDEVARIESALDRRGTPDGASPGVVVIRAGRDDRDEPEGAVTTAEIPPLAAFGAPMPAGEGPAAGVAPDWEPERPLDDRTATERSGAAVFSGPDAKVGEQGSSREITGSTEARAVAEHAPAMDGTEEHAGASGPAAPGTGGDLESDGPALVPAGEADRAETGSDAGISGPATSERPPLDEAGHPRDASAREPAATAPVAPAADVPSGEAEEASTDEVRDEAGGADPWAGGWGSVPAPEAEAEANADEPSGEAAEADAAAHADPSPGTAGQDETAAAHEPSPADGRGPAISPDTSPDVASGALQADGAENASHPRGREEDTATHDAQPTASAPVTETGQPTDDGTESEQSDVASGEPGHGDAARGNAAPAEAAPAPVASVAAEAEVRAEGSPAAPNIFAPPPASRPGAAAALNISAPPARGAGGAAPGVNIFAPPVSDKPTAIGRLVARRSVLTPGSTMATGIFGSPGGAAPASDVMLAEPPAHPADDAPLSQQTGETHVAGRATPDRNMADEAARGEDDTGAVRTRRSWSYYDDQPEIEAMLREGENAATPTDAVGAARRFGFDISARSAEGSDLAVNIVPGASEREAAAEPQEGGTGEHRSRFSSLMARLGGRRSIAPDAGPATSGATDTPAGSGGSGPADLAERAGAQSVSDLLAVSAAWLTLVEDKPRFTRREVMEAFERLPGDHPRTLEARIKGFGNLVRSSTLILVGDGVFAMAETERDRFQAMIDAG